MLQTHLVMIVVFRRRFNNLRPVNRIKHVVDLQGAIIAGASTQEFLIRAVDAPIITNIFDVETGSTVHAIYLRVEVVATTSAALPNVYMIVFKNPGGNLTIPAGNLVGSNDNKKYIIHQEMLMLQKQDGSNPRTLFNGVIKIPRGYKRMGPNDTLTLGITVPGVSIDFCLQCHYKEFR